jgi:hypothetical protein
LEELFSLKSRRRRPLDLPSPFVDDVAEVDVMEVGYTKEKGG